MFEHSVHGIQYFTVCGLDEAADPLLPEVVYFGKEKGTHKNWMYSEIVHRVSTPQWPALQRHPRFLELAHRRLFYRGHHATCNQLDDQS